MKLASKELAILSFPQLMRPEVGPREPPTRQLVEWAVQVYCFSIMSHYREMLRTFVNLAERGEIPAAFVIARCLFEMGAHAYYVLKHVVQYLKTDDMRSAWTFLSEINMGNLYMRTAAKQNDPDEEFPTPRHMRKVIRCFNEVSKGEATASYSFLSEFAHPNMAALSHYYKMKLQPPPEAAVLDFIEPARDPLDAPLPETSISVIALLDCSSKLLAAVGETAIASKTAKIRSAYIEFTKR